MSLDDYSLYVDASAAVKWFVTEPGSELVKREFGAAQSLISSRLLYTEVGSAICRRILPEEGQNGALTDWRQHWSAHQVVELDQQVAQHALGLADSHGLGTLDAIHLASVLHIPAIPLKFATWDRTLWDAARSVGLRTVPTDRP